MGYIGVLGVLGRLGCIHVCMNATLKQSNQAVATIVMVVDQLNSREALPAR